MLLILWFETRKLDDDGEWREALIAALGDQANWRYVEFFTANINNDHTRRAYARACAGFLAWCEARVEGP